MTIPFLICLAGLIIWLLFSKTNAADPWMAELGRICFFTGLLVTLLGAAATRLF